MKIIFQINGPNGLKFAPIATLYLVLNFQEHKEVPLFSNSKISTTLSNKQTFQDNLCYKKAKRFKSSMCLFFSSRPHLTHHFLLHSSSSSSSTIFIFFTELLPEARKLWFSHLMLYENDFLSVELDLRRNFCSSLDQKELAMNHECFSMISDFMLLLKLRGKYVE